MGALRGVAGSSTRFAEQSTQAAGNAMIFSHVRPVAAGYFQCDRPQTYGRRRRETEAGFIYVSSGRGRWEVGPWSFDVRKGDLIALPKGMKARADLESDTPLGYYYVYFVPIDGSEEDMSWPWDIGGKRPWREPCISGPFSSEIVGGFRRIKEELSRDGAVASLAAQAQLMLLGAIFARELGTPERRRSTRVLRSSRPGTRHVPEPVASVAEYVRQNLHKDLSLSSLVRMAHYSERRFVQLFRNYLGRSPMAYVRECRIREAQRLLADGELSIKEVAGRLGFRDPQYFSRVFRQETGISPSDFASGSAPLRGGTFVASESGRLGTAMARP